MKQHMDHCVGAAFVPRAMTCYVCQMQFASIAGYKQHMEHTHVGDEVRRKSLEFVCLRVVIIWFIHNEHEASKPRTLVNANTTHK